MLAGEVGELRGDAERFAAAWGGWVLGSAVEDVGLDGPGEEGGEEDAGCEGEAEGVGVESYGLRLGHCRRWGAQLDEWGFFLIRLSWVLAGKTVFISLRSVCDGSC